MRLCDLAYCAGSVSVDGDMDACCFGPFIYAMESGVYRDVFYDFLVEISTYEYNHRKHFRVYGPMWPTFDYVVRRLSFNPDALI